MKNVVSLFTLCLLLSGCGKEIVFSGRGFETSGSYDKTYVKKDGGSSSYGYSSNNSYESSTSNSNSSVSNNYYSNSSNNSYSSTDNYSNSSTYSFINFFYC